MNNQDQHKQWQNDPNNWVWGIFYFNKSDNRWFLPKRIPGMGFTVNFAKPQAYLLFAGIFTLAYVFSKF